MKLPSVYFGAADRQMEYFLDEESFYESLVSGLLFQGNIVIPDIFFYISRHIRDLVIRKHRSFLRAKLNEPADFFIAGLQEGIIIPSFRNEGTESFRENYSRIVEEGIQGLLPEAESIATNLEDAAEKSSRFEPSYWPKALLSEGFERRTKEVLLTEGGTDQSPLLAKIWDSTREMREACIPDAIEAANKQGRGLRRGTLYNSIAQFVGLKETRIDDIRDIMLQIEDPAKQESVRYLLKWINYCYQVNQGEMFGLSSSLAKLDHVDVPFSEKFHNPQPVSSTIGDDPIEVFSATFKLPMVKQLFTVPPRELLDLRNGEYGVLYFRALSEWQAYPSEETANQLLDQLRDYVDRLCNLYVTRGRNPLHLFRYIQPNVPTGETSLSSFVAETVFKVLESKIGPLGVLTFMGDRIACAYSLLPPLFKEVIDKDVGINERLEFEVTKHKQLLVANNYSAEARLT